MNAVRLLPLLILIACAHVQTTPEGVPINPDLMCADPSGFWAGLWHGLIVFWNLVVSAFRDDVIIYQPCSTGWYDIGFWLGAMLSAGSAGRRSKQ